MRKNVIRYIEKYNNKPPRIGQKVRSYYRNVTHLAKDKWGSDVKEAWQIVGHSFKEDSIEDIKNVTTIRNL